MHKSLWSKQTKRVRAKQLWKTATRLLNATVHNGSHLTVLCVLCLSSNGLVTNVAWNVNYINVFIPARWSPDVPQPAPRNHQGSQFSIQFKIPATDAVSVKVASSLTFCAHSSLPSFNTSDKMKGPKTVKILPGIALRDQWRCTVLISPSIVCGRAYFDVERLWMDRS